MRKMVDAWSYGQFDADYSLPHPGEGYKGWSKQPIPIDPEHTAIVVMHAWDCGTLETNPQSYRICEYVPRSVKIMEEKFPGFLKKVRESGFNLIHIGSQSEASLESLPGYQRVKGKWGIGDDRERVEADPVAKELRRINSERVFPGPAHPEDPQYTRDFAIMPADDEDVACTTHQLFELCKERGITHLIYTGFAINWCLTMSPCGMFDMNRHGVICSAIRDLVTAVENKESCAKEDHKEYGLWAFSLCGGFVFDQKDIEDQLLTK